MNSIAPNPEGGRETTDSELLAIIELNRITGGGAYPRTGTYSVKVWAWFVGRSDDTVRAWIKKYNIPHKKPGDEVLIDAEDWHAAIPFIERD